MRATLGCGGVVAVHVDVDIPLGVLTVVTGVAGSGKSSLIQGSLPRQDGVSVVDQSAIRGFRRSNPATYTGLLDPGPPSPRPTGSTRPYSARTPKACPNCKGIGLVYTDLAMMAGWRPSARNAIIDLGPGAGQDGGRVVLTGTPADLVAHGDSLTARHLRTYLQVAGA